MLQRLLAVDARHGPLPVVLIGLTVLTGLVDAVSFLRLGHVFVSNMTGNVVFLGFAIAGAGDIAPLRSVLALLAFGLGAAIGGRLSLSFGTHRGRFLAVALAVECMLLAVTLLLSMAPLELSSDRVVDTQVGLLALAMGVQTMAARLLGVPDLTTTVVTLTMTALASESFLGTGMNRNARRRLGAVVAMFAGAVLGGALVLQRGTAAALGCALVILASAAASVIKASAGSPAWTEPA